MTDTTQQPNLVSVAAQSAVDTAKALAPALLTAAVAGAAVSNPSAAATAATLAPIAVQLLNTAVMLSQAGGMTDAQLAQLFNTIGQGISTTQAQWDAMNADSSATKPALSS